MKKLFLFLLIAVISCEMPRQKVIFIGDSHMVATLSYLDLPESRTAAHNGLSFYQASIRQLPEGDVAVVWLGTNDIYYGFNEATFRHYIVKLREKYRWMVFIEVPRHIPNANAANKVFSDYGTVIGLPRDSMPTEDNVHFNMAYYKARAQTLQRQFLSNP